MSRESSIYDPLPLDSKSTRVLTLLPNDHRASELRCELKSVKILDANGSAIIENPFYALSYMWGKPDFCHTIICNGSDIKVTPNIFDALKHLRLAKRAKTLWIDAICINLKDMDENSIQIPLMKHIYSQMTGVIIWLGPEDESTKQVLEMIRKASACMLQEMGVIWIPFIGYAPNLLLLRLKRSVLRTLAYPPAGLAHEEFNDKVNTARGLPSVDKKDEWHSLVRFLSRKWFSRCWIKQESALPSSAIVQVGPHLFTWLELCNAMVFLAYKSYAGIHPGFSEVLQNVHDLCSTSRIGQVLKWKPRPLVILLESTRNLKVTVEMDKI